MMLVWSFLAVAMEEPVKKKEVEFSAKRKKEKTGSEVKEERGEERVNRWWKGGV